VPWARLPARHSILRKRLNKPTAPLTTPSAGDHSAQDRTHPSLLGGAARVGIVVLPIGVWALIPAIASVIVRMIAPRALWLLDPTAVSVPALIVSEVVRATAERWQDCDQKVRSKAIKVFHCLSPRMLPFDLMTFDDCANTMTPSCQLVPSSSPTALRDGTVLDRSRCFNREFPQGKSGRGRY
jgi:hypothetical protein